MTREPTGQRCINCKALEYRDGEYLVITHLRGCPEYGERLRKEGT